MCWACSAPNRRLPCPLSGHLIIVTSSSGTSAALVRDHPSGLIHRERPNETQSKPSGFSS